jgi:uncharacterized protein (DUF362 family)
MHHRKVAVVKRGVDGYPWAAPFDPDTHYPEYPFSQVRLAPNPVYDMVRQSLWDLELDSAHRGTPNWNPLREFAEEGQRIVIKPNFALDYNQAFRGRAALAAVVTDGSVLRPVIDYAFKACGPRGRILVCDTPLQNEVSVHLFDNIAALMGARDTVTALRARGVPVELLDLRSQVRMTTRLGFWRTVRLSGDPLGYVQFDLGAASAFEGCRRPDQLETNDWENVSRYHTSGRHLYSVSRSILSADLVISVPKLKVHKKTGLTVALKNMFAISNRKDWIPHWTRGVDDQQAVRSGLDRALKWGWSHAMARPLARFLTRRVFRLTLDGHGNSAENDTTWRGVLDLNRILLYGDTSGKLHPTPRRRTFAIVDGIIAGEGLGPLAPRPRHFGAILAGADFVEVDIVCAQLMQLNPQRIPMLVRAVEAAQLPITRCKMQALEPVQDLWPLSEPFELPPGWEVVRLAADLSLANTPGSRTLAMGSPQPGSLESA